MSKRDDLLHHTYELFSKHGDSVSLSTIAEAASIKKASIYAHFDSKEDLLFQVINTHIQHYSCATKKQLEKLEKESLEVTLKQFYHFNLHYFHEPTRLLFWKRCLLLSEGPLKERVELAHRKVHDRNMKCLADRYLQDTHTYQKPSGSLPIFINSYLVLLLGMLYSLFTFEHDLSSYDHTFEVFWKGLRQHQVDFDASSIISDRLQSTKLHRSSGRRISGNNPY
ncbi:TetR/AcrR family transcriptional regulator [Anoxynatronum buryatiense]|uniref:Transcriptional regulator, TetR family n=1 Tax=Anoxynatronum buryatiense TaxID=489973 RepID=A0AA45WTZ4_9CLOT|nr:TetR/AcrR family transcriptional regulator [Anoxynatronum buryatiense]SMP44738.1 transcriptional regulator, TetR family [Anoxynatronum buryatiense]